MRLVMICNRQKVYYEIKREIRPITLKFGMDTVRIVIAQIFTTGAAFQAE
jgi:hypothetical protein